jgi:hypothetical protein
MRSFQSADRELGAKSAAKLVYQRIQGELSLELRSKGETAAQKIIIYRGAIISLAGQRPKVA